MRLSVIIPTFNEAATLPEIVRRVRAVPLDMQIIVVDDGSTDDTAVVLGALQRQGLEIVQLPLNRGKGYAIRQGLKQVRGDRVIIQDADLEYDPRDFIALLECMDRTGARVVYGNRLHAGAPRHSYERYLLGGMLVSMAANLLYGSHLRDEPSCYKLFDAKLLRSLRLECTGFEFCPEVTAKVLRLGHRIEQVAIHYAPRSFEEGKKIRWRDGVIALWTLLRCRWAPTKRILTPETPPVLSHCIRDKAAVSQVVCRATDGSRTLRG